MRGVAELQEQHQPTVAARTANSPRSPQSSRAANSDAPQRHCQCRLPAHLFPDIFPETEDTAIDVRAKALKAHRARQKKRGMKRLEVSVPAREAAVIRRAAAMLCRQSAEADRLRQIVGLSRGPERPASAADVFAMTTPSSAAGEALWEEAMTLVRRDRRDRTLNRPRKATL